jgi:hypothetical protein
VSRSRRHTPLMGLTCAESEKQDKKRWHSKLRSKERIRLKCIPPDEYIPLSINDASNTYSFAKHGTQWLFRGIRKKYMRK